MKQNDTKHTNQFTYVQTYVWGSRRERVGEWTKGGRV